MPFFSATFPVDPEAVAGVASFSWVAGVATIPADDGGAGDARPASGCKPDQPQGMIPGLLFGVQLCCPAPSALRLQLAALDELAELNELDEPAAPAHLFFGFKPMKNVKISSASSGRF